MAAFSASVTFHECGSPMKRWDLPKVRVVRNPNPAFSRHTHLQPKWVYRMGPPEPQQAHRGRVSRASPAVAITEDWVGVGGGSQSSPGTDVGRNRLPIGSLGQGKQGPRVGARETRSQQCLFEPEELRVVPGLPGGIPRAWPGLYFLWVFFRLLSLRSC